MEQSAKTSQDLFVFIDMDDTLIDTKGEYDKARKAVYKFLGKKGYKEKRASFDKFRAVSIEKNNEYRAKKIPAEQRTPRSILDAALETVEDISQDVQREIIRMGEKVFTTLPQPIRNAEITLRNLKEQLKKQGHENVHLIVLTQGDREEWQREKFEALPEQLKDVFDKVLVVPDKKKATYENVLSDFGITGEQAIMIGDKEGSDIVPALEAGFSEAYHIPVYGSLDFKSLNEQKPKHFGERYQRFDKMSEAIKHLCQSRLGFELKLQRKTLGYGPKSTRTHPPRA